MLASMRPVVFAQFGQHVERIDILGVVIAEALQARHVTDGSNRDAADLAHALGDVIGHRKDLVGVLIEQEMVVAKVRSAHVPMKVLGLHIKREHIGQQRIESAADVFDGFDAEIAGRRISGLAARRKFVFSETPLAFIARVRALFRRQIADRGPLRVTTDR